ncbi:transposase [Agrobacterium rosae]|uniref:transposase n=1 Tax=Agrobacterium rosae TaxID=1972867 RepID=UPI003BA058FC
MCRALRTRRCSIAWHRVFPARPDILDRRRESIEHPFGTIKQWMYQDAFLTRRLNNVRGEFSLTVLAYNIKRAITLVGVPGLIGEI